MASEQLTTDEGQLTIQRVTDGTRTRDVQDHNLALYQLSYGHHQTRRSSQLKAAELPRVHAPMA